MKMTCKHLEKGKRASSMGMCNASITLMIPSIYETNTYCTTDDHSRCPIFMAYNKVKNKTEMHQKHFDITI